MTVHLPGMDTSLSAPQTASGSLLDSRMSPALPPAPPLALPQLLGVPELSTYLGVPVSTIYDWRTRGLGPRSYRFGNHLKFSVADVAEWIESQRDSAPGLG